MPFPPKGLESDVLCGFSLFQPFTVPPQFFGGQRHVPRVLPHSCGFQQKEPVDCQTERPQVSRLHSAPDGANWRWNGGLPWYISGHTCYQHRLCARFGFDSPLCWVYRYDGRSRWKPHGWSSRIRPDAWDGGPRNGHARWCNGDVRRCTRRR